jgi:hypothetical protein
VSNLADTSVFFTFLDISFSNSLIRRKDGRIFMFSGTKRMFLSFFFLFFFFFLSFLFFFSQANVKLL